MNAKREKLLNYAKSPRTLIENAEQATVDVKTAHMFFYRQERLGLFDRLQQAEQIEALYRSDPHSVRFHWITENTPLSECSYVAGLNGGDVLLRNRKGLFGGPGTITALPPNLAVVFKQAKLPITEFGPREVLSLLIDRVRAAEKLGEVSLQLEGLCRAGPASEPCYHLTLHFPPDDPHDAKLVDLFLHEQSLLPAGIRLWLTKDRRREPDTPLDALYWFTKIETNVSLSDEDFELK